MAISQWEPDGTQPPPPPRFWEDPVAGLVTGAPYQDEPLRIDVVTPIEPDLSDEVRRAVDAMLYDDEPDTPAAIPTPRSESLTMPAGTTPGMVPPNPRAGWPRTPSVRQIVRPRQPARPKTIQRVRTRSGSSAIAGVVGVVLVLGVIITIVVAFVASLMNSLSALFN